MTLRYIRNSLFEGRSRFLAPSATADAQSVNTIAGFLVRFYIDIREYAYTIVYKILKSNLYFCLDVILV